MNKKRNFAKMALLGALLCGLASPTFVGCKDYDDDIKDLQEQIDANKATLEKIQELVNAGAIVTKVESDGNGGINLTLSNSQTYHITKGEAGATGGQGIQGPEGPIGPKGDVPTFSIVDGKLIATWSDATTTDLGQVIPEVVLPEFDFAIDGNGNLTLNGEPLGHVVGSPLAVDFKIDDDGNLYKKIGNGEWTLLGNVKGGDATMPSIQFQVVEKKLQVKIGDADWQELDGTVGVGKDDFVFKVENGKWILNGEEIGDAVTYPDVNLTVENDFLCLNGQKIEPAIRVNQSIYVFDNEGVLTINVPKKDGTGYEEVAIPKMADFTNLLNRIQSLVYVPEYSDGKATLYEYQGLMSDIYFEFLATPNVLAGQIVALANEEDANAISMIMQEVISRSAAVPALENIKVTTAEKAGRFVVRTTPKNFVAGKNYSTALQLQTANDNRTSGFINIKVEGLDDGDFSIVKKTQKVGETVELSDEIVYSNAATVIDVLDVNTGILKSGKYVRDFNSVFSQEISYEIVKVRIGSDNYPYGTEIEKEAALAALKTAGFVLTADGDVRLAEEAVGNRDYINNSCYISVKASTGEIELTTEEHKISIIAPATKADYELVNDRTDNVGTATFVWAKDLEKASNNIVLNPEILYSKIEGITSKAELLAAIQTDMTDIKFYVLENGDYVEKTSGALLMVNNTQGVFVHLPQGTSWRSYNFKTTFKLKGADVEVKAKVDFSYPDGTINTDKNPSMWLSNGHMFISGKHDATKATKFDLSGPLSVGFAYVPSITSGIKYEFEIIPTVGTVPPLANPTGVSLDVDKNTLKFATYTYNQVVKIKGYMVFGDGGTAIKEPLTNFAEFVVEPQSPISTAITLNSTATAVNRTYTKVMASNGTQIELAKFLSLKNDRGNELFTNGTYATNDANFDNVLLSNSVMYGLTTPVYTVKSVKVKGTSTERPLMIPNMVIDASGKFSTMNLGTGLAEDLEIEVVVSINNNWSNFVTPATSSPYTSKGTITIFVDKTSN